MYDLVIIGGGPAGVAAGVYAARKRLKTCFITEAVGGQSVDSIEIQNWIGTPAISGVNLAKELEAHLRAYAGLPGQDDIVDIHLGERADLLMKTGNEFCVRTNRGNYTGKAVLIATGGTRRKLGVPGAAEFENKGVTYCASCDGPLFEGQDVAVIGGGNAGFETAAQLLAYCKSVTLVHRHKEFAKADAATVEAVLKHPNMKTITDSEPVEVKGSKFVSSLAVKNVKTGAVSEIPVTGIFVETGMIPSTSFATEAVVLDEIGRVKVNPKNQRAYLLSQTPGGEHAGIWAAGDCTDELYHQNNIAAGDAVKALEDIYFWLKSKK